MSRLQSSTDTSRVVSGGVEVTVVGGGGGIAVHGSVGVEGAGSRVGRGEGERKKLEYIICV